MLFIGDKDKVAIQIEITRTEPLLGYYCLWINSKKIGYEKEEAYVYHLKYALDAIAISTVDEPFFADLSIQEIFDFLCQSTDPYFDEYRTTIGENFDDFVIWEFVKDGKVFFVWKLVDSPFFDYPNITREVQHGEIDFEDLKQLISMFNTFLDNK